MDQRGIWKIPNLVSESKEGIPLHDQAQDHICAPTSHSLYLNFPLPSVWRVGTSRGEYLAILRDIVPSTIMSIASLIPLPLPTSLREVRFSFICGLEDLPWM